MTSQELRHSPYLVILHVKTSADQKDYKHYELFVGTKDGQAKLYDPPNPPGLVPFHELAQRWAGVGLIVSASPVDANAFLAPGRRRFMTYVAIVVAVILVLHYGRRRWIAYWAGMSRRRRFVLALSQCAGLTVLGLLAGFIYHFANDEGFLAHGNATTSVVRAHVGSLLPHVNKEEVAELLNTETVFIDARYARDFKAGHLAGAINVPVNASDDERGKVLNGVSKDSHLVIYCQSAGCKFAEEVTKKLMADGFSDISIFKGGWGEWSADNDT